MFCKIIQSYACMGLLSRVAPAVVYNAAHLKTAVINNTFMKLFPVCLEFVAFQTDGMTIVDWQLESAKNLLRRH